MYERLSKRLEGIIKSAQSIAREYEQEWVGTEHILLAIAREGQSLGARILADQGGDHARIKAEVDKLIQESLEDTWVLGRLPGTPHVKSVMARAIEYAREVQSREVCADHVLLALLREQGSVAYNALSNLGIKPSAVKQQILETA